MSFLSEFKNLTKDRDFKGDGRYMQIKQQCPECGSELYVDLLMILASIPPKRHYHCENCGWEGVYD